MIKASVSLKLPFQKQQIVIRWEGQVCRMTQYNCTSVMK